MRYFSAARGKFPQMAFRGTKDKPSASDLSVGAAEKTSSTPLETNGAGFLGYRTFLKNNTIRYDLKKKKKKQILISVENLQFSHTIFFFN